MSSLSSAADVFQLELFNFGRASEISNQEALQRKMQMEDAVLYKIKMNPNNKVSGLNEVKETLTRNNNENIVLVWEETVPLNTIMLLDVLSDIQFDSKNTFSLTHKCYKKEIDFMSSGGITCVFMVRPKKVSMAFNSFGRRLQEENITLAENETKSENNSTTNVTDNDNDTTPKYNTTIITANSTTSSSKNDTGTTSNSTTNTTTVKPTTPKDTSGAKNKPKPIKTEVASIHPRSLFNSIVLMLAAGLVIAAIVVACIKIKQKWGKKKFLTLPNKKIDVQKLIIKPSFFHHQPESAMVSASSGVVLKPKRSLFLSDTNFAMSPVIDVKTIQHLNLEENHRSSMIPEEVILTNIDDSPESMDSSKTSDASPQDIGFNIEFSILDAQESSKFRGKNLKSKV